MISMHHFFKKTKKLQNSIGLPPISPLPTPCTIGSELLQIGTSVKMNFKISTYYLVETYSLINRKIFICVLELVNSFTNVKMNLGKNWDSEVVKVEIVPQREIYIHAVNSTLILKDPLKTQHNELSCIILSKNYDPFFILNKLNMIEYANKRHRN